MIEDATVPAEDLKRIVNRVLTIERAILRRAWGFAYGIIAAEVFLRLILPDAGFELGFPAVARFSENLIFQTAIALLGLLVWLWIFRRVYSLTFVRKSAFSSIWTRPLVALSVFVLAYCGVAASLVFLRPDILTIVFGLDAAQTPLFYYFLKVTFPEGIPREGKASLLAYGLAATGTTVVTLTVFVSSVVAYLSLWTPAFLVFLLAFARTRSVRIPEPPKENS